MPPLSRYLTSLELHSECFRSHVGKKCGRSGLLEGFEVHRNELSFQFRHVLQEVCGKYVVKFTEIFLHRNLRAQPQLSDQDNLWVAGVVHAAENEEVQDVARWKSASLGQQQEGWLFEEPGPVPPVSHSWAAVHQIICLLGTSRN